MGTLEECILGMYRVTLIVISNTQTILPGLGCSQHPEITPVAVDKCLHSTHNRTGSHMMIGLELDVHVVLWENSGKMSKPAIPTRLGV